MATGSAVRPLVVVAGGVEPDVEHPEIADAATAPITKPSTPGLAVPISITIPISSRLRYQFARSGCWQRFAREADVAAKLWHPAARTTAVGLLRA